MIGSFEQQVLKLLTSDKESNLRGKKGYFESTMVPSDLMCLQRQPHNAETNRPLLTIVLSQRAHR